MGNVKRSMWATLLAASGLAFLSGCEQELPPASSPAAVLQSPKSDGGSVVFVMPSTPCDGLGYYVIADDNGKFIGNLAFGTKLATQVSPGTHVFYAWSNLDLRYDVNQNWNASAATHVTVGRGETQYVTVMPNLYPSCQTWPIMEMTVVDGKRPDVLSMIANTRAVTVDVAAGQAELDSRPSFLQTNLELARWRLRRLDQDEARRTRRAAVASELGWVGYDAPAPSH